MWELMSDYYSAHAINLVYVTIIIACIWFIAYLRDFFKISCEGILTLIFIFPFIALGFIWEYIHFGFVVGREIGRETYMGYPRRAEEYLQGKQESVNKPE